MQLEYSVEVEVGLAFAWQFRADVSNWNDPPAQFVFDGPFESGSCGKTLLPGQPPLHWCLRDVQPGQSFVVEMPLDRAVLAFEWYFDQITQDRTKLTQHILLSGDNAGAYSEHVRAVFGANLGDGMRRIASEMVLARGR